MRFINKTCNNSTRGNTFKLKEERFTLDIRQNSFTTEVARHRNRLHPEAMDTLPMSVPGQAGWGFEQPHPVEDCPCCGRVVGQDDL